MNATSIDRTATDTRTTLTAAARINVSTTLFTIILCTVDWDGVATELPNLAQ